MFSLSASGGCACIHGGVNANDAHMQGLWIFADEDEKDQMITFAAYPQQNYHVARADGDVGQVLLSLKMCFVSKNLPPCFGPGLD